MKVANEIRIGVYIFERLVDRFGLRVDDHWGDLVGSILEDDSMMARGRAGSETIRNLLVIRLRA